MDRKQLFTLIVGMEINSQKIYRTLAQAFPNPETEALFKELVLLELNHEEKVRKMFEKEYPAERITVDRQQTHAFPEGDFCDAGALLDFAISREDTARNNYLGLAESTEAEEDKELLLLFAREEDQHKQMLLAEEQRLQGAMLWFDPSELAGFMDD
jgi:rubrerythrin